MLREVAAFVLAYWTLWNDCIHKQCNCVEVFCDIFMLKLDTAVLN
jgi:hypothetical protein